jgi:hypothetical protein
MVPFAFEEVVEGLSDFGGGGDFLGHGKGGDAW